MAAFAVYRRWLLSRRQTGTLLQAVVRPPGAGAALAGYGLVALAALMVLVTVGISDLGNLWWVLVLVFTASTFEASRCGSDLHQFAFYETGLWFGRAWYPYEAILSYELDLDLLRIRVRRRTMVFQTEGPVSVDVLVRLGLQDWPEIQG